jgi:hypothetical protein
MFISQTSLTYFYKWPIICEIQILNLIKCGSGICNGCGAIPFNVHTPLWTSSIKFEPLRKKDQSADTNTPPEIKKFLPYPSEKMQRSKTLPLRNGFFKPPQKFSSIGGGGVY